MDSRPELSQVLQSTVTEGDKEETTYYFHGKGLLSQENSKGYLTYHFNNVGSTMAVTDAKGKVTETYNYTPYGELIDGTYSDNIPFLYNGQYGVTTDANGLYYMRARYYNVDIKRFVNQDVLTGTLERISSLNRYAYVEGNPVSYLDPFGLEIWESAGLHDIATIINLFTMAITMLFPETAPITIYVSVGVNGFDMGLYLYDAVQHGKNGNTKKMFADLGWALLDLLGIITAGVASNYFKQAQELEDFKDIMGGYQYYLGKMYDMYNYASDVESKTVILIQIVIEFTHYLKKRCNLIMNLKVM